MDRRLFPIFISILLISTSSITPKADDGNIIYVDDDNISGPWDGSKEYPYQHIQDAIDNASNGDTIFVYNGTYNEDIVIDISINLVGESRDDTIIDGNRFGEDLCIVNASRVSIRDIQFRNSEEAAIKVFSSNNLFRDLYFYNNGVGIFIEKPSRDNIIAFSYFYDSGGGLILEDTTGNNIYSNEIKKVDWEGIYLLSSSGNSIFNNTIQNAREGIYLITDCHDNTIHSNQIINGINGVCIYYKSNFNTLVNNTVIKTIYGFSISQSSRCIIKDNRFIEGGGILISDSYNNTIEDNSVDDKPIVYLENCSDKKIDYPAGQVILIRCNNITVVNQSIRNVGEGIRIVDSSNCYIFNNEITNSGKIIIPYLYFNPCRYGITITNSKSIEVTNNYISNVEEGIRVFYSKNCSLSYNFIDGSGDRYVENGLDLYQSHGNKFKRNTVSNFSYGVYIIMSSGNIFSYNNYFLNDKNAYFICRCFILGNKWIRNYWDDWAGFGVKFIKGRLWLYGYILIPWINIDWHPARKPYPI